MTMAGIRIEPIAKVVATLDPDTAAEGLEGLHGAHIWHGRSQFGGRARTDDVVVLRHMPTAMWGVIAV